MLRWIVSSACLAGLLSTGIGFAVEPTISGSIDRNSIGRDIALEPSPTHSIKQQARLVTLPGPFPATIEIGDAAAEPDRGLPQSEKDFLTQQRWARMPAFEIFEEPLPSPLAIAQPPICQAVYPSEGTTDRVAQPRYAPPMPQTIPAPVTVSDEQSARPFSHLRVPAPLADPAAMVVQLFEKLKISEDRAAHAERRLAAAQQEIASLRESDNRVEQSPASNESPFVSPPPSSSVVLLEMRCFEIDLDQVAAAEIELTGICRQELSRDGLSALVAKGAFDHCSSCTKSTSATADAGCPCSGKECPAAQEVTADSAPCAKSSCTESRGQFVEDVQRFEQVLGQLEEAGAICNISRPRLMTRSGETARMTVGREFALKTAIAANDPAIRTELCTAGTNVEARPVVKSDGMVQIELHAQWSTFDESADRTGGRPVLDRRSVSTNLELPAGKTAVAAGLMREQAAEISSNGAHSVSAYGVPVPGEAKVFRNVKAQRTTKRKEMVVLITPKVIAPVASANIEKVKR